MRCLSLLAVTFATSLSQAQPPVTALAFAPAGDALLVGSQAGLEIRAWPSLAEHKPHAIFSGSIHDLQFSPDGKQLLVVGGSPSEVGQLKIVSWPELAELAASSTHDDVIYSAVWLSQNRFVTGAADNQVIEWQFLDGEVTELRRLQGHSRRVLSVEFLEKSQLLVSAGVDQTLRVWQVSENRPLGPAIANDPPTTATPLQLLDNHTGVVRDLAARPGDQRVEYLASASVDKTVRLWQPSIGRLVRFARLPVEPISIAWSLDGNRLAVGCVDGTLRMVNPNTVQVEQEIKALDGWVYEVLAAPDGSFAVGGTAGQLTRVIPEPKP